VRKEGDALPDVLAMGSAATLKRSRSSSMLMQLLIALWVGASLPLWQWT
jgi:hypothetical protein